MAIDNSSNDNRVTPKDMGKTDQYNNMTQKCVKARIFLRDEQNMTQFCKGVRSILRCAV